jgi:hypothetical protein
MMPAFNFGGNCFKQVQRLNGTSSAECTKSAGTPVTNIKSCVVHIVLIGLDQDTLLVVLHHFHHFHHPNLLTLNQGVARFITSHIAFMIELIKFVGVMKSGAAHLVLPLAYHQ